MTTLPITPEAVSALLATFDAVEADGQAGEDDAMPGRSPRLPAIVSECPTLVPDGELWPDRKNFGPAQNAWRRRMLAFIRANRDRFPEVNDATAASDTELRALIDREAATQAAITRILQAVYPERDLGNLADPLDELIYIMISRRTREGAYQSVYQALKALYPTWESMAEAPVEEIDAVTSSAGMGIQRAHDLQQALRMIREELGEYSLDQLRSWNDDRIEAFLTGLPGVGPKSAYCVMIYSLGRAAFPVDAHAIRVLTRVGVLREAGLDLASLDHKGVQDILADLIAPELRHSLHVSLVLHGREVCRQTPRCGECAIRNMCTLYRTAQVQEAEASGRPTMVDLFCGAGGLSEGFRQGGFRTILAVDSNRPALQTYALNHPEVPEDRVICEDLRDFRKDGERLKRLIDGQGIDVLIGGPPCQGFSRAGWRSRNTGRRFTATEDDRNYLFEELVGLLHVMQPRIFIMENVPGVGEVQFDDGTTFLDVMRTAMHRAGYTTEVWLLNAAAYGVPQMRVRRIIIGVHGLTRMPAGVQRLIRPLIERAPDVLYRVASNQFREHSRSDNADLPPPITLGEAIGDLPPVGAGDGRWVGRLDPAAPAAPRLEADSPVRHPQGLLTSHVSRYNNDTDLERYAELQPGENYLSLLQRRSDLQNYSTSSFHDKYFRLRDDQPSKTIVAHLRKDGNSFIHPTQVRSLTVREAARLQSFPDTYIFTGSRGEQFQQIGNAVPPRLGLAIAGRLQTLLSLLNTAGYDSRSEERRGASQA
ncbi:DNA (cytosine-5-)-methyltransferase [Deinococcus taklimakanensis]|uniref:Cytosine-specific methyltransferase n=1 Tax=Deinococcus taklimakanensis TaxID=536443 RepID=A0ABW5P403_9DEIO